MKCASCDKEMKQTFLNKVVGTYIKKDGKKKPVCSECQSKSSEADLKKKL